MRNKELRNAVKSAGFKSISDMARKIEKSREFILHNSKIIQMLLESMQRIKLLEKEVSLLKEILDYKQKEEK